VFNRHLTRHGRPGRGRRHLVGWCVAALAAGAALAGVLPVAAAEVGSTHPATLVAAGPARPDLPRRVTLSTGDRLLVAGDSLTAIGVDPATVSGPTVLFRFTRHGDRYAVPAMQLRRLARGEVDSEVFNVDRALGEAPSATPTTAEPSTAPEYGLTVRVIDRFGATDTGFVAVTNLDTGETGWYAQSGETLRLPAGRYAVTSEAFGNLATWDTTLSVYSLPQLRLDRDITLTLDHRKATPITVDLDEKRATRARTASTSAT
jgi:hypothetical protein